MQAATSTRQKTRQYPRIKAKFRVDCTEGNESFQGMASSLGGGGLFLLTKRNLAAGTEILLQFRPARRLPLMRVRAKVCYAVAGQGAAVEFLGLDADQRQAILRLTHRKPFDRRDFTRAPLAAQIECDESMSLAFAREVGGGGMFVETKQPKAVGSRVSLRFNLDDGGPPVSVAAEVTYAIAKLGMGVQFVDLTSADRRRIEAFVRKTPATTPVAAEAK